MAANSRRSAQGVRDASAESSELKIVVSIRQLAHEQILRRIEKRFSGHALERLVGAVLHADYLHVEVAGPGPDGGVDILASNGYDGFGDLRICVQVKSSKHPIEVETLRALRGSMLNYGANQGILVAWGGFTKTLISEARRAHFKVRLWGQQELVEKICSKYDRLPESVRSELPLERVWVLADAATG